MSENLLGPPTPKCKSLIETCRKFKYVLASGPRYSTKTICCLLALCDHAYTVKNANIVIITVSQSAGLESGVWSVLIDIVVPSFGLQIVKKPYIHAVSKKPAFEVRNKYGQTVKIQLDSLKDEREVEKRYKGKDYSMIYIPELSNFRLRMTFDILGECLRGVGVAESDFLFLADTNPSDEGDQSWIYFLWYILLASETFDEKLRAIRRGLALVEFTISDNVYASEARIEELKSRYAHDPDLYARYIMGEWVTATEDALFARVFKPNIHIIGDIASPTNTDPEIMVPTQGCFELITGWDMGVVNSAFCVLEKWRPENHVHFKLLDEQVVVGEDFEMAYFVEQALEKMAYWENYLGVPILWRHWSDRSALDFKEPVANKYHHELVFELSGGRVQLEGATRTREMLRARIDLLRKLLFQDRFWVSASCRCAIQMLKSIKKGRGQFSVIQTTSRHKHSFDSISYPLSMELFEEIEAAVIRRLRPNSERSGVVSVGL
jgi:hypothetical protein